MNLSKQELETIWYSAVLLKARQQKEEDPDLPNSDLQALSEKVFMNWFELKESEEKLSRNAWVQESFLGQLF